MCEMANFRVLDSCCGKSISMVQAQNQELAQRMAEMARAAAGPRTVAEVLSDVTATARELIPGVDTAGVLLVGKNGKYESLAGTTELPHKLDDLQMTFDEGPCVQAAVDDLIVRTDDFRTEERWPQYSPAAVQLGVLSGLSVKLYTANRTAGALNLFAFKPQAFDGEDETVATILAAHAAAAILSSRHGEQLQSALTTRDRIGQAKGIIMERYGIDDVAAFNMLKRLSQESNVKLADIAQQVIDTRSSDGARDAD